MATVLSPSSPSPQDDDQIPTGIPSIASASRRLPPPCWSPEETVALIDAYKDKWYSLRRGNLRANHWQEVADDVGSRCPASPPKTAVQCRHKMEKLRKRYRAEIQRAVAHGGVRRFTSSWVHFQRMHSMEKGPNPTPPSSDDEDEDDHKNSVKRINDLYNFNQKGIYPGNLGFETNGASGGVRIKIPGQARGGAPAGRVYPKIDEIGGEYPYPRLRNPPASKVLREGDDGVGQVVAAIQALVEGFMRVEKAKMDMVRQVEEMRMEMELKRTEMILESQHKIVETFANAITERNGKRAKRSDS